MNNNKKTALGYICAVLMSLFIGLQFVFIKNIVEPFEGKILQLLFIRFALCLAPFIFFIKKIKFKSIFDKNIILLSVLQPFLNLLAQTYGVALTSVTSVAYVTSIGPLLTILLSAAILKEKISGKQTAGIAMVISGAVIVVWGRGKGLSGFGIGSLLIFAALALRSLYSVLSKEKTKDIDAATLTFGQLFWGMIMFLISSLIFGGFAGLKDIVISLDMMGIISLLYVSFISLTAVYLLNNISISKISVTATGILSNLTFIVTLASGLIFMKEEISVLSIIGAVIIMAGVILSGKNQQ